MEKWYFIVHEEGRDGFFAERYCPYPSSDPRFDVWWEGYNEACADTETEAAREAAADEERVRTKISR